MDWMVELVLSLVCLIFLVWLIGEIAIGFVLSRILRYDRSVTFDREIGWRLLPNLKGARKWTLEFSYSVYTDAHGFRIGRDDPRDCRKCDVLFLGDSFCFGEGVEAEHSVVGLLRRENPHLGIFNAAVPGYGTDQEYLTLKRAAREGLLREGATLILFTYINDFCEIQARSSGALRKPRFTVGSDGRLAIHPPSTIRAYLCSESKVLHFGALAAYRAGLLRPHAYMDRPSTVELYCRLVASMSELAKHEGCRFAIIYSSGPEAGSAEAAAWSAAAESAARRVGVRFVNLDENLGVKESSGLHFSTDIHWNRLGNQVAYGHLRRRLFEPLGLVDSKAPAAEEALETIEAPAMAARA